jgi:hypothetical protein
MQVEELLESIGRHNASKLMVSCCFCSDFVACGRDFADCYGVGRRWWSLLWSLSKAQ